MPYIYMTLNKIKKQAVEVIQDSTVCTVDCGGPKIKLYYHEIYIILLDETPSEPIENVCVCVQELIIQDKRHII